MVRSASFVVCGQNNKIFFPSEIENSSNANGSGLLINCDNEESEHNIRLLNAETEIQNSLNDNECTAPEYLEDEEEEEI